MGDLLAGLRQMHYDSWFIQLNNFIDSARSLVAAVRENNRVDYAASDFERRLRDLIRRSNGMSFDSRVH